jgi:methyltransferase (TIGR00027 family)
MLQRCGAVTLVFFLFVSSGSSVEPGLPSRTAVAVLNMRAVGARHPDPAFRNPDYLAAKFLGPRERGLLPDAVVRTMDLDYEAVLAQIAVPFQVLITNQVLRTRHIDAALETALASGTRQIIVLGAGYDSRAYRFQQDGRGTTFFEVDYGPTQEYKKIRVKEIWGELPKNVRYVPMDFTKDNLLTQLERSGYSTRLKTLFIWEGVSYYLPEPLVRKTFQFVRDHSVAGSAIIFDYIDVGNPRLNNPQSFTARVGEPMIFGFPIEGAGAFVRSEGLEVASDLSFNQLYDRYARRSDGSAVLPLPVETTPLAGICTAVVPAKK